MTGVRRYPLQPWQEQSIWARIIKAHWTSWGDIWWGRGYLNDGRGVSSYKLFTDYKRENRNFTVEKPGHHSSQEIKVNITNNGTNSHPALLDEVSGERHNSTAEEFLLEGIIWVNQEETPDQLGDALWNTVPDSSQERQIGASLVAPW